MQMKVGFPQGDNLSGFLFSISLRYVLKQYFVSLISAGVPTSFATVLDDTLLAFNQRTTPRIGQHIHKFIHILATHNLKINVEKSIVFCKELTLPLITQIRRIPGLRLSSTGFDVCRIPVGTTLHIQSFIEENYLHKINNAYDTMLFIWQSLQYLSNQERFNTFYIFLRLCFASRFAYWIRNLPPSCAHPVSQLIDAKIDALSKKLYPQIPSSLVITISIDSIVMPTRNRSHTLIAILGCSCSQLTGSLARVSQSVRVQSLARSATRLCR
jgi:hypothetical protein